jgi:serine/threonine protein phosphatase PrpC
MQDFVEDRDFSGAEIVGDRKNQEDFHTFQLMERGEGLLLVLADGMGGHEAGEVASSLAVDSFVRNFRQHGAQSIPVKLGAALQSADNSIANYIASHRQSEGMGCTLVGAYVSSAGLYWISVGDSPLYLFRKGKLRQINEDHSMAPEIEKSLKAGKLSPEEARNHPNRNALRSAVMGEGHSTLVDCPEKPFPLAPGDLILLASDGVQSLSDTEIANVLAKHINMPMQDVARVLLRDVQKKQRRNQDNTTVQLVKIPLHKTASKRRLPWRWILASAAVIMIIAIFGTYVLYGKMGLTMDFNTLFRIT